MSTVDAMRINPREKSRDNESSIIGKRASTTLIRHNSSGNLIKVNSAPVHFPDRTKDRQTKEKEGGDRHQNWRRAAGQNQAEVGTGREG